MDVTEQTIRLAYRLFLDRDASDTEIIEMAANKTTIASLRKTFLNSREFEKKFDATHPKNRSSWKQGKALIHLHVPKTAGSSLTRVLAPYFATGTQLPVSDGELGKLASLSEQERRNASFVFGHLSHGMGQHLPQGHNYICVLRKPGQRLLSYYNYLKRTKDHQSHKIVVGQKMSFGTFLEWAADSENGHLAEVKNGQVRRLAGLKMQRSGASEAQMLPEAIKNITAPEMMYGLTEHFDHFVQRLHEVGLIAGTPDMRENVAPIPANLEEALAALSPVQGEIYHSFTGWDEIFYNISERLYFAQDAAR